MKQKSKNYQQEDLKHANILGEIEAFKETKYWFKRDIKTLKIAAKKTIKYSPLLILPSLVLSLILSYTYFSEFLIDKIIFFTVIFYPLVLLAYFLFYVMVKKGYDIQPYLGTSIDQARNPYPEKEDEKSSGKKMVKDNTS